MLDLSYAGSCFFGGWGNLRKMCPLKRALLSRIHDAILTCVACGCSVLGVAVCGLVMASK